MTFSTGRRGSGYALGPDQNTFSGIDLITAAAVRDAYFASNPAKLAAYDSNSNSLIRLVYPDTTVVQGRSAGAWVDYSGFLQGQPGEVASLVDVRIGEVPFKRLDGTFGSSRLRVLDDGSLLAPPNFGVESGSIAFGDVILLSESAGFLAISNNLNGNNYTILDYQTPRDAASSSPHAFILNGAETPFLAQGVDTTNIPDNPLIFNYTVQNDARTNALTFRAYAPMTNVRVRVSQVSNGVVLKYIPTKEAWETELNGMSWAIGDNTFDFEDSPVILEAGNVLKFEIYATSVALKGNASGIPYMSATLQTGVFRNVIMDYDYTPELVRDKLASLSGANRLGIASINGAVTSVAGRTGAVVLSPSDVAGLAAVASSGAYSSLSGLPFIPTKTSDLTNDSVFITSAGAPVQSVNGLSGVVILGKVEIGLPNVDNTSDANKPTSTAQQASIDLKMSQHNALSDPHPQYTTTSEAAAAAPVQSVAGRTGAIILTTGDLTESGNLFYTDARVGTYLTSNGYTIKSVTTGGTGASVLNNTTGGIATLRNINGSGLITVTQNANDITIAAPTVTGGTYTPTLTNQTNVSASTAYSCQWMRVDGVVTVSGKVDIDPTSNAVQTRLGISLPVASNFGANGDCGGVATCVDISQVAGISADVTNDRATLELICTSTANRTFWFTFTYRVI